MSFVLDPSRSIRRGLKDAVRDQLRSARTRLELGGEDAIHQARKSVKKVRAILTLLELAGAAPPAKHRRGLRAAGRHLASVRDSDVVIATFDHLCQSFPEGLPEQANASIRRALVGTQTRIAKEALDKGSAAKTARALRRVRRSVKTWDLPDLGRSDLAAVLTKSFRVNRRAMARAQSMREEDLHRWRKRVKTHWYQLRLVQPLAPSLTLQVQALGQLETWLGEHHDLAVLQASIAGSRHTPRLQAATMDAVRDMCVSLQETIGRRALTLGQHLLAGSPKVYKANVRRALASPASAPSASDVGDEARALPPTSEGGLQRHSSP